MAQICDFDEILDRKGSGCFKYDGLEKEFGRSDLLPLWIADMDFRTPDFITGALKKRLEHPVLGYPVTPDDYFDTVAGWVENLHGWRVDSSYIRYIPGVVKGIGMVMDTFLKEGDKVVIQPPVYHPFRLVPEKKGIEVVFNPLLPVYEDGCGKLCDMLGADRDRRLTGYRMDLDSLECLLDSDRRIRLLVLSNPHNPAGICWDSDTLKRLAEITSVRGVIVVSDEIHSEMALGNSVHVPYASVSGCAASNSITFMAPSKTFNMAGVVSSYAIVPDEGLRGRFFSHLESGEFDSPSIFAVVATMAAYREGMEWRNRMLDYVLGNVRFVDGWLKENLPAVRALCPQASFLVWLDCRSLGLAQPELVNLFLDGAHLALNDGSMFGCGCGNRQTTDVGCGFMRLNVGCPRSVLENALERLRNACLNYKNER